MKLSIVCFAAAVFSRLVCGELQTPLSKIVDLISDLQKRMITKGQASQEIYNEFAEWCTKQAQAMTLELKADKAEKGDLESQIHKDNSIATTEDIKGDEEVKDITQSQTSLKEATALRQKEAADFRQEEKELIRTIDMLKRAQEVLEKEMAKHGASMMQLYHVSSLTQVLRTLVGASSVNSADADRLSAMLQTSREEQNDADDEEESAAPSSTAYTASSGPIVNVIADLLEKGRNQLTEIRAKEEKAKSNFALLKASLKDEIAYSKEDKVVANKAETEAQQELHIDEGDLGMTVEDVQADVKDLDDLRRVCMQKVEEFTAMHKSRDEELKALAEAKKFIEEKAGAAGGHVYDAEEESTASLLQIGASGKMALGSKSHAMSKGALESSLTHEVLHALKKLAARHHSHEMAQLASRIAAAIRADTESGEDPFAKVVGMISDMISQLEDDASADENKKQYCDKELGVANQKKSDREDAIEHLSTKFHQMTSRSKKLKSHMVRIQAFLSKTSSAQAEMDSIRHKEHQEFLDEKQDLDQGLSGIKMALKVLNDYYQKEDKDHKTDGGAANNIITLLETIESDFSKSLAELMGLEEVSQTDYEKASQENEVVKAKKEKDVEHKTKEMASLDKALSEIKSDKASVQNELDAVSEYLSKLQKECIAQPDSYEERKARRAAEITGLKDALHTLESETALLQLSRRSELQKTRRHFLA